jgi:hypothetical protein
MSETTKTTTTFLKITRAQMDEVTAAGTKAFAEQLQTVSDEELQIVSQRVRELRAQKTAETYLVFPCRQEKQQAAGVVYLRALAAFEQSVRAEQARRSLATMVARKPELELATA